MIDISKKLKAYKAKIAYDKKMISMVYAIDAKINALLRAKACIQQRQFEVMLYRHNLHCRLDAYKALKKQR